MPFEPSARPPGAKTTDGGTSPSHGQVLSWSLVLHAARIPHEIVQGGDAWHLLVRQEQKEAARQEIERYEEENRDWPPPRRTPAGELGETGQQPLTILLLGALFIFYGVTGPWASGDVWFAQGAVSRTRILEAGEWWRLITGLTLHADEVHLLGNLLIGGILIHFLFRLVGSGIGLLGLLSAGGGGNALNVALRTGEHLSVGFSTAVFGTVGLLSGLQLAGGGNRFRQLLLPLGAGLALLALLGTEGERTDLGAHLWGTLTGVVLGAGLAVLPGRRRLLRNVPLQLGLFLTGGAGVWGCWWLALR